MFNSPAPVALIGAGHILDCGQHFGIGGIADSMDRNLEFIERGTAHQVAQLGWGHRWQSDIARIIGIGPLQPRTARPQRSVQIQLHPVEPQFVLVQPRCRPGATNQLHRLDPGGIGHDSQVKRAIVARTAERLPILDCGAHVGDGRDPVSQQDSLRVLQCQVAVLRTRFG